MANNSSKVSLSSLADEIENPTEDVDLLAGLAEAVDAAEEESEGVAWMPHDPEKGAGAPNPLVGMVTARYSVDADMQKDDDGRVVRVPVLVVTVPGAPDAYQVRAYHSALRSKIEKKDPQPGDGIAIKLLGQKEGKAGRSYWDYACIVRKPA